MNKNCESCKWNKIMEQDLLHIDYVKELKELKEKMVKATVFSRKVPLFSDKILGNKLTGEEGYFEYGKEYKELHLYWGIGRAHYISGTNRKITNYNKKHDIFLWNIYISTFNLYDSLAQYGLNEIEDKIELFFYDKCNSTFYCTDDQIETLLDSLLDWFILAKKQHEKDSAADKIKEEEKKMKNAENEILKMKRIINE